MTKYQLYYCKGKKVKFLAQYQNLEDGLNDLLSTKVYYANDFFKKKLFLVEIDGENENERILARYFIKGIKNKNIFFLHCDINKYPTKKECQRFYQNLDFCNTMEKQTKSELYDIYCKFNLKKCNKCFVKKSKLKYRLLLRSKVQSEIIDHINGKILITKR